MALHTQREGLNSLQQQETIEWRQRSSGVSLSHSSTPRDIGGIAVMLDIDNAVIGGVRVIYHVITVGLLAPRKRSADPYSSALCRAMPSHVIHYVVNHHV